MTSGLTLLTAVLLLSGRPLHPLVHGEGVLTAERGTMAAGESLKLSGASFEPDETYEIKLVGPLQEFLLDRPNNDPPLIAYHPRDIGSSPSGTSAP